MENNLTEILVLQCKTFHIYTMGENKDTNINFRTTTKMKENLEKIAAADTRSLSSMIEILLMEAIEARRKSKK